MESQGKTEYHGHILIGSNAYSIWFVSPDEYGELDCYASREEAQQEFDLRTWGRPAGEMLVLTDNRASIVLAEK